MVQAKKGMRDCVTQYVKMTIMVSVLCAGLINPKATVEEWGPFHQTFLQVGALRTKKITQVFAIQNVTRATVVSVLFVG